MFGWFNRKGVKEQMAKVTKDNPDHPFVNGDFEREAGQYILRKLEERTVQVSDKVDYNLGDL